MQLINASVYDQQTQARAKAIARTAEERSRRREERDRLKLSQYLRSKHSDDHVVEVGQERFKLVAGGSKLVRISGTCPSWIICNISL
jgi:hypothetical protein